MTAQGRLGYYAAYVESTIPPVMVLLYSSSVKQYNINLHFHTLPSDAKSTTDDDGSPASTFCSSGL